MSYLYSKLPETGVPHRIGTGGHGILTFKFGWSNYLARTRVPQQLNYFEPVSGVASVAKG
jgi:hypothetical protein